MLCKYHYLTSVNFFVFSFFPVVCAQTTASEPSDKPTNTPAQMFDLLQFINNFQVADAPFLHYSIPIIVSIVYVAASYAIKFVLGTEKKGEEKPKQQSTMVSIVKNFSLLHNVFLVVLSISMFCGIIYAAIERYTQYGFFRGLICPSDAAEPQILRGQMAFWIYVFHLSKYYELLDTFVIVLLRKDLIFLHIYHHFIMIFLTWSWLVDDWLVGSWWCVVVNSTVHTFMYYYYLQTALGKHVSWKQHLTTGQIIQLMSGFVLVCYWLYIRTAEGCERGFYAGWASHISNGILIFEFVKFFVGKYLGFSSKRK